jgi:hypothetical protein
VEFLRSPDRLSDFPFLNPATASRNANNARMDATIAPTGVSFSYAVRACLHR